MIWGATKLLLAFWIGGIFGYALACIAHVADDDDAETERIRGTTIPGTTEVPGIENVVLREKVGHTQQSGGLVDALVSKKAKIARTPRKKKTEEVKL